MSRLILLILIVLMPVQCFAADGEDLFIVCADAPIWWTDTLDAAETELNRVLSAVIVSDAADCDLTLTVELADYACTGFTRQQVAGCYIPDLDTVFIADVQPEIRLVLLLHELAHALGISGHTCDPTIDSVLSCQPPLTHFGEWDMHQFAAMNYPMPAQDATGRSR